MRVIVAAVAIEEPQTAPKQAEAQIVAMESPPFTPERRTRAALKSSAERPVVEAMPPVMMKRGMTESV